MQIWNPWGFQHVLRRSQNAGKHIQGKFTGECRGHSLTIHPCSISLQHTFDPEPYRLHYYMSWSLLISFVLCVMRSVGSVVTSDTEESPSQERTSHSQASPHKVQSSEISLISSWTNESAWEAAVPHYPRSGISPKWFGCCQALRAVCTECPTLVTAMGSPHRAPAATGSCLQDFCAKGTSKLKEVSQMRLCIEGRILSVVRAHVEPWGRCSQGLGGRKQPQVSPSVVTSQEHSPSSVWAVGWDCWAASPGGTAQDINITIYFSPLVFGKNK